MQHTCNILIYFIEKVELLQLKVYEIIRSITSLKMVYEKASFAY